MTVCNNMQHSASCFWCHTSVMPVLLSNTLKSPQEILIEPQQSCNRLLIIFQSACYERQINSGPVLLKDFHTAAEEEPDLLSDMPWLHVEGSRSLSQHFCVRLETIMTWMTGGWCLSLRDDGWGCIFVLEWEMILNLDTDRLERRFISFFAWWSRYNATCLCVIKCMS